ncbi:MAG: hypothetical protein ACPLIG_07230 [Candidatus Bathyarchaeales archaeon]
MVIRLHIKKRVEKAPMNRKILVGIALIIAVAATSMFFILQQNTNPKIPLNAVIDAIGYCSYGEQPDDYYWCANINISLASKKYPALYNCSVIIKYQTEDGTWKTITHYIGTVYNYTIYEPMQVMVQFDEDLYTVYDPNRQCAIIYDPVQIVEAYGYTKPLN